LTAAPVDAARSRAARAAFALLLALGGLALLWETVLAPSPAVTAEILFGVLLIVIMTARPQGLIGTARVEIV